MNGLPTAVCAMAKDHQRCCGFGADGTPCGCECHGAAQRQPDTVTDYDQIRQILAADMTTQPSTVPLPEPNAPLGPVALAVYGLVQEVRSRRAAAEGQE